LPLAVALALKGDSLEGERGKAHAAVLSQSRHEEKLNLVLAHGHLKCVRVGERRVCSVRAACVQWVRRLHRGAVLQSRTALCLESLVYKEGGAHQFDLCELARVRAEVWVVGNYRRAGLPRGK